jgi:hypothetical protein
MQRLVIKFGNMQPQLPPLVTLATLQKLDMTCCSTLKEVPPLETLKAPMEHHLQQGWASVILKSHVFHDHA